MANSVNEPTLIERGNATCIIGAGPGGLAAARALKSKGLPYDHFERHSDVGGIWDIENPGSPMYESAHFISSRDLSSFLGFPMPAHYADYPSSRQILEYVRSFAEAYGLYENIAFRTSVEGLKKDAAGHWLVQFSDGSIRRYVAVICSTGSQWDPSMPAFQGNFTGQLRHSVSYKSAQEFRGKRVLIVGAGNSGADIACDAASNANKAFISMRRGYYFVPKHMFGVPADVISEKGPHLPMWLARPVFGAILRIFNGDLTRLGLPKPDHRLFDSHPLLNSQLLHHLQHGNIAVKPDISHFDGDAVVFKDGSREYVDLVLCATGYKTTVPFAAEYFTLSGGTRPDLYLSIFSREHRNLFGTGFLETNSAAYKFFDTQAFLVGSYLQAQQRGHASAAVFDQLIQNDRPDLTGGLRMVGSGRHETYVDAHALRAYLTKVRKRIGWADFNQNTYDELRKIVSTARAARLASVSRESMTTLNPA
ncbi:MAG TPA: NAD(P)-binding domain-containing protein [Paraburkholderia sp.]